MSGTENKGEAAVAADPVPDGSDASAPASATASVPASLAQLEEERRRYFDQLLRLKAEFENYRKRVDREKPEWVRYGKRELLERLIPLYDVLLDAHDQVARHADGAAGELARGLEMIFSEFTKLFKAEGIETIPTVGERYDFDRHEVLGQVESDECDEGVVVEELQRGYLIGGKTLRAAKVRVSKRRTL